MVVNKIKKIGKILIHVLRLLFSVIGIYVIAVNLILGLHWYQSLGGYSPNNNTFISVISIIIFVLFIFTFSFDIFVSTTYKKLKFSNKIKNNKTLMNYIYVFDIIGLQIISLFWNNSIKRLIIFTGFGFLSDILDMVFSAETFIIILLLNVFLVNQNRKSYSSKHNN